MNQDTLHWTRKLARDGGIKSGAMATAKATLNTVARIYGISSEGATLLGNRIANSPVALELVQIGAGGGVAVVNSFLTPDSPSTLTGLPVVDYWSMAFSISWNFRK